MAGWGRASAVADAGRAAPPVVAPPSAGGITSLRIVAGLAMAPAVVLGLARFAYALLSPAMRADLGWTYADAGAMNTANAAGYLLCALAAAAIAGRVDVKRAFAASILATTVAVCMSGATPDFGALMALRFVSGLTNAIAFVAGGSLAAAAAGGGASRGPTVLGVYFGRGGIGVAVSALAVPPLLATIGWQGGWTILGALALIASLLSLRALARAPRPARASARIGRGAGRSVPDDFSVGQSIDLGQCTVTEADILAFAASSDPEAFHLDPEAASMSSDKGLMRAAGTPPRSSCGSTATDRYAAALAWGRLASTNCAGWHRSDPATRGADT